jgi:LPS sulfotransferase NodH
MPSSFKTKFVILTMARTGSNALVGALNRHPSIMCDYEVFHHDAIYTSGENPFGISERNSDPLGFLDRLIDWRLKTCSEQNVYGFKLFLEHEHRICKALLADPSWQKILLKRENLLDQYISLQIAWKNGAWTSLEKGNKPTTIMVDTNALKDFIRHTQRSFLQLEKAITRRRQEFLTLDYADIKEARLSKLFQFLGVAACESAVPIHTKQNSARSADKILNPDEVRKFLKQRRLSHFWVE